MMRSFRGMAKWVMVVMAVAFFGWLVFDVGMAVSGRGSAPTRQAIAKVNGTTIDVVTYQAALQQAQEQRSKSRGGPITLDDQKALGDQVLEDLMREILLNQELKRRNLKVSNEEIIAAARSAPPPEIEQAPEFQTDGQFDNNKYQRYLSTNPEGFLYALETRYRTAIPQNKLIQELASTVYVPTTKLWRMYQDQNDSVTATFALLQPELYIADTAVKVTDDQLQSYFKPHRDDFKRPATAYLSYIVQSRAPSPTDSAQARDSVRKIHQKLAQSADFGAIAKEVSADSASAAKGGDLGEIQEKTMIPAFEKAALELKPGQTSQPVLSPFGYHIIKLDSRDAKKKTYHAHHILIPIELTGPHRDAVESRADSLDRLAAEQNDATVLDSVARHMGLAVQRAPSLAAGTRMQLGRFVIPDVGVWAFTARPGETSAVIETDLAYYVFRLDSLQPEGIPSFDRVKDDVRRAVIKEQKTAAARTVAQAVARDLQGAKLRPIAERLRIPVTTLGPFTRTNPPIQIADALPVIGAAFGLPIGQAGGPYETESGIYFVEPVWRRLADSAKFTTQLDTLRMRVLQAARRDRVQQVIASLREDAKVSDRRQDLEKAQKAAEDAPQPQKPTHIPGRRRF
jgi:peptidyl-prolyl cis-trans isomerase D